ncbi:Fic family protein [Tistrella bauzanensis]|uniref:Fic family protein n=1 Tax=Tistrella bauzanensis TaxID=657419 RepID=UPI00166BBE5A|nr:Fic family protein [Tistrella bauzanensis]
MAEDDRHSKTDEPALISGADEKARREIANASAQFDLMVSYITEWVAYTDRPFRFRPSMILDLQRAALNGLSSHAGTFRASSVTISKSAHQPPGAHLVPRLVEDMCDYINDNWRQKSATYLSAYVLWRLNWIHPFDDGNGRTSRAVSYVILCVKSGILLPGEKTIPEQISANKTPY